MADKEEEEWACAECFLRWYNQRQGVNYTLKKTEEEFPQLKNRVRWDFLAIPNNSSKGRCAIEVKRLIRPQLRIQRRRWITLLRDVSNNLSGKLRGEFLMMPTVALSPTGESKRCVLRLNHRDRSCLVGVLTNVVEKSVANMRINDEIDLGPAILSQFPSWPRRLRNACELRLHKRVDSGCSLKLGALADSFWSEEVLRQAINGLDMTTQLGLAGQHGIRQTILLLDCRVDWSPNIVKQVLIDKGFSSTCVDIIYLVEVSQAQISEVWSSGKLT